MGCSVGSVPLGCSSQPMICSKPIRRRQRRKYEQDCPQSCAAVPATRGSSVPCRQPPSASALGRNKRAMSVHWPIAYSPLTTFALYCPVQSSSRILRDGHMAYSIWQNRLGNDHFPLPLGEG